MDNNVYLDKLNDFNLNLSQKRKLLQLIKDIAKDVSSGCEDIDLSNYLTKDDQIDGAKIINGTLTSDKYENNTLNGEKIINESIASKKLQLQSITTEKIQDGAITEDKVGYKSISSNKIKDFAINASHIEKGVIPGDIFANKTIPASKLNTTTKDVVPLTAENANTIDGWSLNSNTNKSFRKNCSCYSNHNLSSYLFKVGTFKFIENNYANIVLFIYSTNINTGTGIIRIMFKLNSNNTSEVNIIPISGNLNVSDIKLYYENDTNIPLELWINVGVQHRAYSVIVLSESSRGKENGNLISLIDGDRTEVETPTLTKQATVIDLTNNSNTINALSDDISSNDITSDNIADV